MASKDKAGITKIRKKINKELQKTSSQIESLIGEALRQIEGLQQQIQEPVKKLITDLEKIREREMKRFHDEFDRRMAELHDAQTMLMERIGLSSSSVQNEAKRLVADDQKAPTASSAAKTSPTSEPTKSAPARKSTTHTRSAARKNTKTAGTTASKRAPSRAARDTTANSTGRSTPAAAKSGAGSAAKRSDTTKSATQSATARSDTTPATAKKPASASKAASSASSETGELGRIKGIGPATASKLKDKGITRVQQIANPSEAEQKALEQIANAKTRSNWQRDARSQVAGSTKP